MSWSRAWWAATRRMIDTGDSGTCCPTPIYPSGRLKTEAQFLLTAVRGIYMMALALRDESKGDVKQRISTAIQTFIEDAPGGLLLRHLHEHLDEYMRGGGRDRAKLPQPDSPGVVAVIDDGVVYEIGGKGFKLRTIAEAADRLSLALRDCFPG